MRKILFLEDNKNDIDFVQREILKHWPDVNLVVVSRISDAKKEIEKDDPIDIALFDLNLPDGNSLNLLSELRETRFGFPIIILTGIGSEEIATAALKAGANDYIPKKYGFEKLIPKHIEYTLKQLNQNRQDISVLYVERHKSDLELTSLYLKKQASYIHLIPVSSGEEALKLLPKKSGQACKFDVLMLDYRLPGMNAIEITRIIRQERGLSIAIVIVTGQGDENTAVEAIKVGVDDYIVKHENYLLRLPSVLTSAFRRRELERQQKALSQSEKRFKRLFHDLGDAVFVTRIGEKNKGEILEVNAAAVLQTGYSREELLKMNIIHDLAISGTASFNTIVWENKLLAGEHVCVSEKKRKKDGTAYWTEVIVTPIEFNGEPASLSINHDISILKRAELIQQIILNIANLTSLVNGLEQTVEIIQKELGKLMDTKNFYVALYDKERDYIQLPFFRDEKDEIKEFPAAKTLTGLVIKQGKSILIDDTETKKLQASGKIETIGSNSEIWLGVPLKTKGEVIGAFVVQSYHDSHAFTEKDKEVLEIISHQISLTLERKQEEEKLKKALEAAKESDRMKTAFLANMSHELRTPLNAVIGFSALIDEKTSPEESKKFAELINSSGSSLLEIVDEIFEVTLIERGEVSLNRTEKRIDLFLNDIFQLMLHRQKNLGNTEVMMEQINSIETENLVAFTDFEKLKQIFIHLLSNSLKFTSKGLIQFGLMDSENEESIKFYVRDTGIGIPKEKQQVIFERFKIVDDTRTREYAGIGNGLFIVQKFVKLLGGRIQLESIEGEGTTFYFSIPK